MKNKKILIVTGEASGDLHAASLVKAIHQHNNSIEFYGVGGKNMQAAGVNLIEDCAKISLVGLTEIIFHFFSLYAIFKKIKNFMREQQPDLVILVDCPSFNLRLAKVAKKLNLKVFYYISPQLWAWHQSRVKLVKKYIDVMAVIFPFEVDFYQKFNVNAKFVGHPLAEKVKPVWTKPEAKKNLDLADTYPIIGLLPGSRKVEIKRLLPLMIKAAELLKQKFPDAQFILPLASSLTLDNLAPYLKTASINIKIISGHNYDVVSVCDAAMVTSGTATLETGLLGIPMVVVYKASLLTAIVAKLVLKVPYLCICNIIAGKPIVKELLQLDATSSAIAKEITQILSDENYRTQIHQDLNKIKASLQSENVTNAAELVLSVC